MFKTIKDLYNYSKHYPSKFIIGFIALVVSTYAATLPPLFIGKTVDAISQGNTDLATILPFILALLAVVALSAFGLVVVRRTILNASWEIQFDIRRDIFNNFTKLDANYYDNHRVGDMMARLTADLSAVRMMVGVGSFMGTNILLFLIFTLYRMFQLNLVLSLLTLLIIPAIGFTFFALLRTVHNRYQKVQEQLSNVSAMAQENFSGVRVVKGFGIENRELATFRGLNDEFIRRNLSLTRAEGPLFPLMELFFGITISLLLLIGGRYVMGLGGNLTIGEFIDFVILFENIQWPMIGIGWIASILQRGHTSWERLKELLAVTTDITDNENTDYSLTEVKGDIEFQNVSLKFGAVAALENVSFKVAAGENLGITGRTGSGKTMIANLISRVIEPTYGHIFIDGVDIKKYPIEVLRRHIGLVPQEPFLFSDTITENIAFGIPKDNPDAVFKQVKEVAKLVQLARDIEDFPQQYETPLGERGVTLSGGQRQRTAMARAIIRDPDILILDDALSAVDTQTEASILEGLAKVSKGCTTVVIGHRISGFKHSDKIIVLEQGKVVEQGTHEELIDLDGFYADMDRRQQLEKELEAA